MKFKILAIVTFLLFDICFWAQNKMKYKDVVETVESNNSIIAYQTLQAYVKQCIEPEPELLNAYYRISLICYKWAKEFDPLKETYDASYFTDKAIVYLDSSRNNMNEKKFRKTRKYFTNLTAISDEKLRPEDILLDINEKHDDISNFKKNVDNIVENFNAAADKYEQCLNLYRDINARYDEINDLYLKYDDKLESDINYLVKQYKEVLMYFENYKKAIKSYPIKGYKQDYLEKKINVYRLDGLTSSSFFNEKVLLWDYQSWANEVKAVMADKIGALRKLIASKNKLLNQELNKVSDATITSQDYEVVDLGKDFLYATSRFDKSLFIYKLLNYKTHKASFINFSKSNKKQEKAITGVDLLKQARYYNQLLIKKQNCDTILDDLGSKNLSNKGSFKKYEQLLTKEYKNFEGLKNYFNDENKSIMRVLTDGFKNFHGYLNKYENRFTKKDSIIRYGKIEIPLHTNAPDLQEQAIIKKHYTTAIYEERGGSLYIVGFQQNTKKDKRAFVARTKKTEKVLWLKYFDYRSDDNKTMDNIALEIKANQKGCYLIVYSRNESEVKNTYIQLSAQGKKIAENKLNENNVPRKLYLDEVSENLLVVYKGTELRQEEKLQEDLILKYYNSKADSLLWQLNIPLVGEFVDLNKTSDTFYILANFFSVDNKNSNRIKAERKSLLSLLIKDNGQYNSLVVHKSEKALNAKRLIKINSDNINIVGTLENKEFLYLLTNALGQKKYWNIKE